MANQANWLDDVYQCLERIYRLMGGDPAKFAQATTLTAKMGVVASQYLLDGIPSSLSEAEREELGAEIHQVFTMLDAAPFSFQTEAFLSVLKLIWIDLGFAPDELMR